MLGSCFPEVFVLQGIVVTCAGRIAYYAHTDKIFFIYVASLRYGSRLHIHGESVGERILDAINLLNGVDKLVARANQSTAQRVDIGEIVQYRRAGMIV